MTAKTLEYYMSLHYTIRLQYQDDCPCWYAEIAELPGCIAGADTRDEVLDILEEAKETWLISNLRRSNPIPEPSPLQ